MQLSAAEYFRWALVAALEVFLFLLVVRRGLARRYPIFLSYLGLLLLYELCYVFCILHFGYSSMTVFIFYWTAQELLLIARGAVVVELCWRILYQYEGIWRFCRILLLGVGVALLLFALLYGQQYGPWIRRIVLATELGLEVAILGLLICGLAFCRHYGVPVERPIPLIALGFGFYSVMEMANDTLLNRLLQGYYPLWKQVRLYSFDLAILLWIVAIWRTLPAPAAAPTLFESSKGDALYQAATDELHKLNERLKNLFK